MLCVWQAYKKIAGGTGWVLSWNWSYLETWHLHGTWRNLAIHFLVYTIKTVSVLAVTCAGVYWHHKNLAPHFCTKAECSETWIQCLHTTVSQFLLHSSQHTEVSENWNTGFYRFLQAGLYVPQITGMIHEKNMLELDKVSLNCFWSLVAEQETWPWLFKEKFKVVCYWVLALWVLLVFDYSKCRFGIGQL